MSDDLVAALRAQGDRIVEWLRGLENADFARPSALDGWDLRLLTAHLTLVFEGVLRRLDQPVNEAPLPAADYVRLYRPSAEQIDAATVETADDEPARELVARIGTALAQLPDDLPPVRAVFGGRGPISPHDWILTRVIEAVVHSDDLSRSLPERVPVPMERAALASACRTLADFLSAAVPGRTVEVRIPPFVAVQVVDGPRHTRGTPPNVVEMDGLTWVRIATGRVPFADAVAAGKINASGQRADLTPYLPLL